MRFKISLLILFLLLPLNKRLSAQELDFNGYISNMQTAMFQDINGFWSMENQFHNRLNFKLYTGEHLYFDMEMRNRFIYGDFVKMVPGYADYMEEDPGWLDMSWLPAEGSSFLLHSTIDRLYMDLTFDRLQIRLGRQRINWSQSMVWNPNDIFNAYSYFDFDYAERPGSDAVRLQYYTGNSSSLELVAKLDSSARVTAGSRFLFSLGGYDLQLVAGWLAEEDLMLGTGWSGNIGGAAFRGEFSWFHSPDDSHKEEFMFSVSGDYTFRNSIYVGMEFLYSNVDYDLNNIAELYFSALSVKDISFTDYNLMANIAYPFTPLFTGSFAAIYYPSENGFFMGPALDYSLKENISLYFITQHFRGDFGTGTKQKNSFAFLRLKWNF